jgi:hypothetical protein
MLLLFKCMVPIKSYLLLSVRLFCFHVLVFNCINLLIKLLFFIECDVNLTFFSLFIAF